ncbi:BBE domain-containing protein [Streptomyces polygonati]|uniref:BBE domain-containing protein n=1 Tax=Streptomyces polygonati TaxID=1617087 RepID=A0ABV8HVR8_9ACTN
MPFRCSGNRWKPHRARTRGEDATEDRTRQACAPDVYERLRTVKAAYDPRNRFRLNRDIPPRAA